MARKKATGTGLSGTQQTLQAAVMGKVEAMQLAIVETVEANLFDFILGGGLDAAIVERMTPYCEEFEKQATESLKSINTLPALPSTDSAVDVGACDA